jgi:predicted membrane protein
MSILFAFCQSCLLNIQIEMSTWLIVALIALFGIISLAVGTCIAIFTLGVWTYAHVYRHFVEREEKRASARVASLVNHQRITEQRLESMKRKIIGNYHPLSDSQRRIVDEEMEGILGGAGKAGGR